MIPRGLPGVRILIAAIAALLPGVAECYERTTHADMSENAALNSQRLREGLPDLGLSTLDDQLTLDGRKDSIRNWFRDGARREDDTFSETFARYRNHFFDPRLGAPNNGGFTGFLPGVLNLLSGLPAPDWALEPTPIPGQFFGFKDARSYFLSALTQPAKADRDSSLAKTFRTVGQVIHLIQDMGQPQHTRNDSHMFGSLYERYVDRSSVRTQPGLFLGSAVPQFGNARDFFINDQGSGIAQYTNRAFVSQDTNFRWDGTAAQPNATYTSPAPLPDPEVASVQNLNVPQAIKNYCGLDAVCNMRFYRSQSALGEVQERASTLSIFADDLALFNTNSANLDQGVRFSLNTLNFKAVIPNLVPVAVGYSTGMIDYFFRGKLDYVPDTVNTGGFLIKNLGPEPMKGKFQVYYDDQSGTRHPVDGALWDTEVILAGAPTPGVLGPGESMPVPGVPQPVSPPAKTLGEFMLVFTGEMGNEKPENGSVGAVVAKAIINPYSGALYVSGLNAAGQLQVFKVDKNGVSLPDGSDVVAQGILRVGTVVSERSYDFKQTTFTTTATGTLVHKTVGLEFAGTSISPDLLTGVLRTRTGSVWTAKSADPAIGTFEFTLQVQGTQASLFFTRAFINASGQTSQVSGIVPFPQAIDFKTRKLLLSGDGTTIYPIGPSGAFPGYQITLAAIPTIVTFTLPSGSTTFTQNPPSSTTSPSASCSMDYISDPLTGAPRFPATATAPGLFTDSIVSDTTFLSNSTVIVDLLRGTLLSYQQQQQSRQLERRTFDQCAVAAVDYSIPATPQAKVSIRDSRHTTQLIGTAVTTSTLPEGSFKFEVNGVTVSRPANAAIGCGLVGGLNGPEARISNGIVIATDGRPFLDLDYSYQGFAPCPTPQGTQYDQVDTATSKQTLYRALTDRALDAVYTDQNVPGVFLFRGQNVPSSGVQLIGSFVADASPIGEVFFATPDLSILVHEPKPGNMPVLTRDMIPPGIVKLIAAFWM